MELGFFLMTFTYNALQPCDFGAFEPLAQLWKQQVMLTSQALFAIRKDHILVYYHAAQTTSLSTTTIQLTFQKTGIWPLDHNAISLSDFKPSKNTTTQAAQPLLACPPSILVPTPTPTPSASALVATTSHNDADILKTILTNELVVVEEQEEEPME